MTLKNPTTRQLKKISVLLDTGAELSFIDEKLAEELRLLTMKETTLPPQTFGPDDIEENLSRKVPLEVRNVDVHQLSLFLFTHDAMTKPLQPPQISPQDVRFIRKHNLQPMFTKKNLKSNCFSCWAMTKC
uniref:Peptidase A2 domain-containing protein n=1 Tax=Angiostrongylus cantonensis TaxID=6313 RepID=A0A0K0DKF9_ANGCA